MAIRSLYRLLRCRTATRSSANTSAPPYMAIGIQYAREGVSTAVASVPDFGALIRAGPPAAGATGPTTELELGVDAPDPIGEPPSMS